jgi:epoxide hydrolase-like predicted phosphatase
MPMKKIKCIIFDFGGVVTQDKIEPVFEEANRILNKKAFIRRHELYTTALKGKISAKEHYEILSKKTGISPENLEKAFTKSHLKIMKLNKTVLKLVKDLKSKGYQVVMISNITEISKNVNKKRKIFPYFSPAILSCDVKSIKPQKRIFEIALQKINLKPEECVFIDDRKELLQTPQKMGFKTINFKNTQQLTRDLKKLDII